MKTRVLFISGREVDYMRNRVLLAALKRESDVTVLTPNLPGTWTRLAVGLARFLCHRAEYDVCLAGFYGQPLAIALSMLQPKPIVLDAFVSTFDTLCEDRRRFRPDSLAGRLAHWIDRRSCQVSSRVLTDTQAYARYFSDNFGVPLAKLEPVYVGCDESLFYPRENAPIDADRIEVFYYGAFLPLHGTEVIVQAAALLRTRPDIHFTIGGDGTRRAAIEQMISDLDLGKVNLTGWIPVEDLPDQIARASICLGGHFSTVPKASRVISTKTFQFVAMRKPTIVGDNPATREIFAHGESVWAAPMGDPRALADAIQTLADDPTLRHRIAAGGHRVFQERLTTQAIAGQLALLIEELSCASAS